MQTRLSPAKLGTVLTLDRRQNPIQLNATHLLWGILLVFTGTFTVTGGSGVGTLYSDSLYRLFEEITYKFRGDTILTLDGLDLYFLQTALNRKNYPQTLPSSLAAGASQAVKLYLKVPFAMPHSATPEHTALPSWVDQTQKPELGLKLTAAGVLATGEDGTLGITDPTLDVYEEQLLNAPMSASMVDGDTPRAMLVASQTQRVFTQAGTKEKIYLPTGLEGQELRMVLVKMFSSDGVTLSNSAVDEIGLFLGGTHVQEKIDPEVIQDVKNVVDYNLAAAVTGFVNLDSAADYDTTYGSLWYIAPGDSPYIDISVPGACTVKLTCFTVNRTPGY